MTRFKWPAWVFGAVLILLFGSACGKRGTESSTSDGEVLPLPVAKDENGWPFYEVLADGFGLALPPDWRQFDMDPKRFEAKFKEVMAQNPQFGPLLGTIRQQLANGVRFFGVDQATVGKGFATNVNVIRVPLPSGVSLDATVADTIKQLNSQPGVAKPISGERQMLAAGEAERLRYKLTMKSSTGQSALLAITQYLTVRGNDGYVVTLTTLADQEARYARTFEGIGQSFRFIK